MAGRLKELGMIPEMLFTSPASRALNTALIMSRVWEHEADALQIHEALYMAYSSEIDEVVSKAPDQIKGLAIFGHNPSFTIYANHYLDDPLDNLPTSGIVIITFEMDQWNEIAREKVIRTYVDYPKRKSG
jgi:phosphohistidine phosphatase